MTGASVTLTGTRFHQTPALTALRQALLPRRFLDVSAAARRIDRLCWRLGQARAGAGEGAARLVEVRYLVFIWSRSALGFWYRRPKLRLAHVDPGTARRLGRRFTLEDMIV